MKNFSINRKIKNEFDFNVEVEGVAVEEIQVQFLITTMNPKYTLTFECESTKEGYSLTLPPLDKLLSEGTYAYQINVTVNGFVMNGMSGTVKLDDSVDSKGSVKVSDLAKTLPEVAKENEQRKTTTADTVKKEKPTKPAKVEKKQTKPKVAKTTEDVKIPSSTQTPEVKKVQQPVTVDKEENKAVGDTTLTPVQIAEKILEDSKKTRKADSSGKKPKLDVSDIINESKNKKAQQIIKQHKRSKTKTKKLLF